MLRRFSDGWWRDCWAFGKCHIDGCFRLRRARVVPDLAFSRIALDLDDSSCATEGFERTSGRHAFAWAVSPIFTCDKHLSFGFSISSERFPLGRPGIFITATGAGLQQALTMHIWNGFSAGMGFYFSMRCRLQLVINSAIRLPSYASYVAAEP